MRKQYIHYIIKSLTITIDSTIDDDSRIDRDAVYIIFFK